MSGAARLCQSGRDDPLVTVLFSTCSAHSSPLTALSDLTEGGGEFAWTLVSIHVETSSCALLRRSQREAPIPGSPVRGDE
jgi:hypothetical protein